MVNAEFSRIYRFVKLLVNEGFLAVYFTGLVRRVVSEYIVMAAFSPSRLRGPHLLK